MVSVIIPAYNRPDLLDITLTSVKQQTLTEYEIIIIDDCSQDNKIRDIANKYSCTYIKNKTNLGAQVSRNIGIQKAKFDYIAFLDSDDIWNDKNKLSVQHNLLVNNKSVSLVFTRLEYINITGLVQNTQKGINDIEMYSFKKEILRKDFIGTYSSVMVRKKDILKVGMCSTELPARQDWDLWIKLSALGSAYKFNTITTQYRIHDEQISSNFNNKFIGYIAVLKKNYPYYKEEKVMLSLMLHFVKILFGIKFYKLTPIYKNELQELDKTTYKRANVLFKSVMLIIKIPVFKQLFFKKLSKTYLFKGIIKS